MSVSARASRFAHLIGLGAPVSAVKESEEDEARRAKADPEDGDAKSEKKSDEEAAEEEVKRCEDDLKKARAKLKAAKKNADDEEDDGEKDGDDKDDDEPDDDEDDEDDEKASARDREDMASAAARAPRLRERARCAAIFADAAAARSPALAAQLAFGTDLPRREALCVLRTGGAAATGRLAGRMAGVAVPAIGGSGTPAPAADSPAALIAEITAVYETARGIKR